MPGGAWLLMLDASLAACSAAVAQDGAVRAARQVAGERGHAATLPVLADQVLAEAGIAASDLAAVGVVVGPGGFTGLRCALALAQGLALGAGRPVIGVTTGEALAAAHPTHPGPIWAAIDHRQGRVLLERFAPGSATALGPPEALALDALPPAPPGLLVVGDLALAVGAALGAAADPALTDAAAAIRIATLRLAGTIPPRDGTPLYGEAPAVRRPAG